MVCRIEHTGLGRIDGMDVGVPHFGPSNAGQSAVLLASDGRSVAGASGSNRAGHGEDTGTREVGTIARALQGNPEALLAFVSTQLRRTKQSAQQSGAVIERSRVEEQLQKQQEAVQAALEAAEEASGFLGLGEFWGDVAKVAGLVAAAAVTVVSGGSAAAVGVAVAGMLLATYSDEITQVMVDLGMPQDLAPYVSVALKVTGSLMAGGGVVAAAGAGAAGLAGPVSEALREAGVAEEIAIGVAVAMVIAGAIMTGASGGAGNGSTDAAKTVNHLDESVQAALIVGARAARLAEAGAGVMSGGTNIAAADAQHDSDSEHVRAERHGTSADEASGRLHDWVDGLKDTMRQYQRMIQIAQQAAHARGETLAAAAGARG